MIAWGQWVQENVTIKVLDTRAGFNAAMHSLRQSWRVEKLRKWVDSRSRRVSQLARDCSFVTTAEVADQVRKLATTFSGDACEVICGGMKTAATSKASCKTREISFNCHREVCPSVTHILWECPTFDT